MGNDTQYVQMDIKIVHYVRDLYIASVLCNRAHVKKMFTENAILVR